MHHVLHGNSDDYMKRLYLLRHAKSGWDDPTQDDFDRSLTRRGRRSAPLMGRFMQDHGYAPSIALCSPARRAHETWDLVRDALNSETAEEMRPELYLAEPQTLLDAIRKTGNAHSSAIIISHNPGILTLALGLMGKGMLSANPFGKYPTAALTVFDFDVEKWPDVHPGQGRLIGFTRPKELDSTA